jgi:hypothetical protein
MDAEKNDISALELELSQLEQIYALAFEAGKNPEFLNAIWNRIKKLKVKILAK